MWFVIRYEKPDGVGDNDGCSRPQKKRKRVAFRDAVDGRPVRGSHRLSMWQVVERVDADRIKGTTHFSTTGTGCRSSPRTLSSDSTCPSPHARPLVVAGCSANYSARLRESCALLRTNVFPNSLFSDVDASPGASRTISPECKSSDAGVRSQFAVAAAIVLDADARSAGAAKKLLLNRGEYIAGAQGEGGDEAGLWMRVMVREWEGAVVQRIRDGWRRERHLSLQ
jgi:hypothetical protein